MKQEKEGGNIIFVFDLSILQNIFGHEQQHMVNSIKFMEQIEEVLKKEDIKQFKTENETCEYAKKIESDYQRKINEWLIAEINHKHGL